MTFHGDAICTQNPPDFGVYPSVLSLVPCGRGDNHDSLASSRDFVDLRTDSPSEFLGPRGEAGEAQNRPKTVIFTKFDFSTFSKLKPKAQREKYQIRKRSKMVDFGRFWSIRPITPCLASRTPASGRCSPLASEPDHARPRRGVTRRGPFRSPEMRVKNHRYILLSARQNLTTRNSSLKFVLCEA